MGGVSRAFRCAGPEALDHAVFYVQTLSWVIFTLWLPVA
jgi:hypothetical protein